MDEMKIMLAIPCMEMIHTDFAQCVWGLHRVPRTDFYTSKSSLIYDARNTIARTAMEENYDFILWLDSDMVFGQDILEKMTEHYKAGRDIVSALFFTRKKPILPCIYESMKVTEDDRGVPSVEARVMIDYPKDTLFQVKGTGFACTMTSVKAIRQIADIYGPPFYPRFGWGEDLTFSWLAQQCGIPFWVDSTMKIGHIGAAISDEVGFEMLKESYKIEPVRD